jgi:murein DD-endopeptidase MepM/ murein hydrolase activator NlpD
VHSLLSTRAPRRARALATPLAALLITVGFIAAAPAASAAGVQKTPDVIRVGPGVLDIPVPDRPEPSRDTAKRPFVVCPVDRPREYTDDFGASRYVGGYHTHTANDITAPEGTKVRAPFDGRAEESYNGLGGLTVKVYGRLGYVVHAHLSKVGKLGKVRAGDVVGFVGQSGDAMNPHDHFEWHPGGGDAVSPFRYLNSVCTAKPAPKPHPVDVTGPLRPL